MSSPVLDPSLPAENAPVLSGELRGQFQAIQSSFDDIRGRLISLTPLGLTVSNPPTQADVQAIADKLDELINTLSARQLQRENLIQLPGDLAEARGTAKCGGEMRFARADRVVLRLPHHEHGSRNRGGNSGAAGHGTGKVGGGFARHPAGVERRRRVGTHLVRPAPASRAHGAGG
jgi:hypothetical protein